MILIVLAVPVFAKDFVLNKSNWSAADTAAVVAAGGQAHYAHSSGIAVVTSDDPNFAANVNAAGNFQSVTEDMVVQCRSRCRMSPPRSLR